MHISFYFLETISKLRYLDKLFPRRIMGNAHILAVTYFGNKQNDVLVGFVKRNPFLVKFSNCFNAAGRLRLLRLKNQKNLTPTKKFKGFGTLSKVRFYTPLLHALALPAQSKDVNIFKTFCASIILTDAHRSQCCYFSTSLKLSLI